MRIEKRKPFIQSKTLIITICFEFKIITFQVFFFKFCVFGNNQKRHASSKITGYISIFKYNLNIVMFIELSNDKDSTKIDFEVIRGFSVELKRREQN